MGRAWRKNQKNILGKPDIVGRDVFEFTGSVSQAPAAETALTGPLGESEYYTGVTARLEGAVVHATGDVNIGRIGVSIKRSGATLASGTLYAGGTNRNLYLELPKEEDQAVAIASGDALTALVSVEQTLDAGNAIRAALSLALLEHSEE